jgi:hypothetical protein
METFLAILGFLGAILSTCTGKPVDPKPSPEPTLSPSPTPCPTPAPLPEPRPTVFYAPDFALVGTPFTVSLCEPFEFNVGLTVDGKPVGTFGSGPQCMQIIVPGFSGLGKRTLKTKNYSRTITIFDARATHSFTPK